MFATAQESSLALSGDPLTETNIICHHHPVRKLTWRQKCRQQQKYSVPNQAVMMVTDDNGVNTNPDCQLDPEASSNIDQDTQMQKQQHKHIWRRLWLYVKQAWTGVMARTEPIMEEMDLPHRYRPENLHLLCEATGFSVVEMKRIYRGFKTECPTGMITEEAFHGIYSRFFPHGAQFIWRDLNGKVRSSVKPASIMSKKEKKEVQNSQANLSSYSHYVFSTLDHEDSGIVTFEDFVIGLSILVRGTMEEKIRWMFSLYDQDRDGYISREEMEDVVGSVFDLMGRTSDPVLEEEVISERVDHIFERMDLNGDGMVSMDEFLETCLGDESISRSIVAFSNVVI